VAGGGARAGRRSWKPTREGTRGEAPCVRCPTRALACRGEVGRNLTTGNRPAEDGPPGRPAVRGRERRRDTHDLGGRGGTDTADGPKRVGTGTRSRRAQKMARPPTAGHTLRDAVGPETRDGSPSRQRCPWHRGGCATCGICGTAPEQGRAATTAARGDAQEDGSAPSWVVHRPTRVRTPGHSASSCQTVRVSRLTMPCGSWYEDRHRKTVSNESLAMERDHGPRGRLRRRSTRRSRGANDVPKPSWVKVTQGGFVFPRPGPVLPARAGRATRSVGADGLPQPARVMSLVRGGQVFWRSTGGVFDDGPGSWHQ
jgi:hypothetical protein